MGISINIKKRNQKKGFYHPPNYSNGLLSNEIKSREQDQ